MSKLVHTNLAVTSATLASELQASAATAGTTTSTNCTKSGLVYSALKDARAVTTTTVSTPYAATVTVVDDAETSVA
jgi:hypothetical protein